MIQYRICWSANSNVSFTDSTAWDDALEFGRTRKEVEQALYRPPGGGLMNVPVGLEIALEASGFEWHVEMRLG